MRKSQKCTVDVVAYFPRYLVRGHFEFYAILPTLFLIFILNLARFGGTFSLLVLGLLFRQVRARFKVSSVILIGR